jgi:LPS sulfotransferase NodH
VNLRPSGAPQTPIWLSYAICATPRSGSNFVCEMLQKTGVAGRPDEYFLDPPAGHERWRAAEWRTYIEQIRQSGTTPNGVFGVKVMRGYFNEVVSRLAALIERAGASPPEILAASFPNLRYIWLTRRDKVRQGVSWRRALLTQRWRSTDPEVEGFAEGAFDFEAIDGLVQIAIADDRAWQRFFDEHGIEPLTIVYEEMDQGPEHACRQILNFLQISAPLPSPRPTWRHQRQADSLTDDWVQQYHARMGTTIR